MMEEPAVYFYNFSGLPWITNRGVCSGHSTEETWRETERPSYITSSPTPSHTQQGNTTTRKSATIHNKETQQKRKSAAIHTQQGNNNL